MLSTSDEIINEAFCCDEFTLIGKKDSNGIWT